MITKLTLENFKSFEKASIPLTPFTLVVGANGAGKSNFFDALRFLKFMGGGVSVRDAIEGHSSVAPSDVAVPGIRGGASELVRFGADASVFRLKSEMRTQEAKLTYSIGIDVQTFRVVSEELTSSERAPGSYVFSTHPEAVPLSHDPDSPSISARFYKQTRGPNPRREFSPHSSILSQFKGRAAESNLNEDVADQVRQELTSITPLELRPDVLRQYAPLGTMKLGEHGEQFAAVLWLLSFYANEQDTPRGEDSKQRLEALRAWLSELTPRPITDLQTQRAPTGEVIFAVREGDAPNLITARSLSDGTLRFAAIAIAMLGSSDRGTLLIEEIENGLNPARLQLLVDLIDRNTGKLAQKQVIASTHSPTMLDLVPSETLDSSLVFGWDADTECTHVVRLKDLQGFEDAVSKKNIGDLQAEGWLQFAADK